MRLKQRIVRILIREIIADVEEKSREVVLVVHWAGGRHSELRVKKSETGSKRRCTDPEAIEVLRQMAGKISDQQIAATLNLGPSQVSLYRQRHQEAQARSIE